jgi:AraC family transcriptional regulator
MSGTGPARWFEREPLAFFESRDRHTVNHSLILVDSPGRGAPRCVGHSHTTTVAVLNPQGKFATCSGATTLPLRGRTISAEATEHTSQQYLMAAARLVEAACCARVGDGEGAKSHIANALALLDGQRSSSPGAAGVAGAGAGRVLRGGLAPWQARRVAAHIDANLAGQICIKDLAVLLDISTSHFCRAFKCTFGTPARAWIGRRRIEVAQALMLSTRAPLSEIALSCGMSDQSHFTRAFRRIVGETPHSWRQTRRGAIEDHITDLACARANQAILSASRAFAKVGDSTAASADAATESPADTRKRLCKTKPVGG